MSLLERLQALQKKKEAAEQQLLKLQGRHEQLLEQLEKHHGVSTVEEGQKKLSVLDKDISRREERAERLLAELEQVVPNANKTA